MNKRHTFLLLTFLMCCFILTGCGHEHTWTEADCTAPRTCTDCGEIEGEALGHTWIDATCTQSRMCERCEMTEGEPLGHNWKEATCTIPKTCEICNAIEGMPIGHIAEEWVVMTEATKTSTGTRIQVCTVCDEVVDSETIYYYDITEQEEKLYTNALDTYYSLQQIHLNPESFTWLGAVVNNQTLRTTIYISYIGGDNSVYTDYFWKDLNEPTISNKYGEHNYQSDMLSLSQIDIDEMLYFEEFCGYEKTLVSSGSIEVSH